MKKNMLLTVFVLSFVAVCSAMAGQEHEPMPPYTGSPQFEQLKTLAGTWEGTSHMGENPMPVMATYEVTSNGSAVVEKLFEGTPNEMVTVYYEKDGKPAMTHYCALANRPQMDLVSSDAGKMDFSFSADNNIDAMQPHMHALSIAMKDSSHITQNWTFYQSGEVAGTTTVDLSRVR